MGSGTGIALWGARVRRGFRRPPGELVRRLLFEAKAAADRFRAAPSARLGDRAFARLFGASDMTELWEMLRGRPYPAATRPVDPAALDAAAPGESARIREVARRARALEVDVLGSGPVTLASPIDWHVDVKSGHRWPVAFFRDLDLNDLGRASDVKVPWELSRLQWLIPVGQDYRLGGDPAHARFARDVLESWIVANPYARSVNWGVAMEAAMRLFTWTWLFHVFAGSEPWQDRAFQGSVLRSIYDHAIFCARYIEDFGTSSNHLIADAAGIAVAGMFLGDSPAAYEIAGFGMAALHRALPRQLTADGVSHEGSAAYHRLVAELVFWSARYWLLLGYGAIDGVAGQLRRMAELTAAITGPDDLVPAWGDSDDSRVLPFGGQAINDHSYLPALIGSSECGPSAAARAEIAWALGPEAVGAPTHVPRGARAFASAGVYVMAGERDHVVIDCGPAGHAHGHNDALSFEATLDGVRLITDSGSYVYTASVAARNRFRSAAAHNAPIVDGAEPSRLPADNELFVLRDEARASVRDWQPGADVDRFVGTHSGYRRLAPPVRPVRTLVLDKRHHRLSLRDDFDGGGPHEIVVRLHFAGESELSRGDGGRWLVHAGGKAFAIAIETPGWEARATTSEESPRYGVKSERPVLELVRTGPLAPLALDIRPV